MQISRELLKACIEALSQAAILTLAANQHGDPRLSDSLFSRTLLQPECIHSLSQRIHSIDRRVCLALRYRVEEPWSLQKRWLPRAG